MESINEVNDDSTDTKDTSPMTAILTIQMVSLEDATNPRGVSFEF